VVFGIGRAVALASTLTVAPQLEAWTTSHLESVVWADVVGGAADPDSLPLSRVAAMAVPAVARARHLTAGAIAKLPLYALRGAERVPAQPYWCQGTDGQTGTLSAGELGRYGVTPQSPWSRMLWTVDDHLFHGVSVWLVSSRYDDDGRPARMLRVPFAAWSVDDAGRVTDTDGHPFPAGAVVVIPGPHEGVLNFAGRTIRAAGQLEHTAADVARRPFRLELHQTTDAVLTSAERRDIVQDTRAALAANDGVLFTNSAIETKEHRMDSEALLIGARNASALDIARDVSMPAAMLDATTAGASLEYATLEGRNQQWIDYGLSLYMAAVESRLGMDDVIPAGQRMGFDTADLTGPASAPAGAPTHD
jgi:hypothetical protein